MKANSVTIRRWFDRHLHIRDGAMMQTVLPATLSQRATGAVIMPNLADPISTVKKATAYREIHRIRVRKYATSGDRRFGAGTDSAPHDESLKSRCYGCAAGIFTAPVAVEMYTTVFDEDDALNHLGPFLSENFLSVYGVKVSKETMTIERRTLDIPEKIGGVQVFKGGSKLSWKLLG
jgi:dihydroorotase